MPQTDSPDAVRSSHAKKRTDEQVEMDRIEIARLYFKRLSQKEIAASLNSDRPVHQHITGAMVGHELRKLRRLWKHEAVEFIDQAHSEMLREIQEIEREAWIMWQRSKGTIKTRRGRYVDGKVKPTTVEEVELVGDPRYLSVLLGASQRKAQLLGIAEKLEINSFNMNIDLTKCNREELRRIAKGESPQVVAPHLFVKASE